MLMGAFIPRQRMKSLTHEYISELHLVVGLILFTLADAKIASNFSVSGLSEFQVLVMDSFRGNLREAIFTMNLEIAQGAFVNAFFSIYLLR
ncbi:hypothetical protein LINPERHAP2_LOCUS36803 [Linum perenne]